MILLEIKEYALLAAHAAAEKKASDVVVLDVAPSLVITDYFVIASGATDRQVHAIADEIEAQLKAAGLRAIGREGEREAKWILLDFGDIVVHVFQPDEREFYRLEKLWNDTERLTLPSEITNASPEVEQEHDES
ncbi:MAG: ribosome silencing factor [Actinobacteria bacterium HGW-Actinobacteria-1]|nr:MAG: ribosome silencing factor [Actinobacteria bacterium HGW-Actinobacteria-1]